MPPFASPGELVAALRGGSTEAREQLQACGLPVLVALVRQQAGRHQVATESEELLESTLQWCEMFLVNRPQKELDSLGVGKKAWRAFAAYLVTCVDKYLWDDVPKQESPASAASPGSPAAPTSCPEPAERLDSGGGPWQIHAWQRPRERVGGDVVATAHVDARLWLLVADVSAKAWVGHALAQGVPHLFRMVLASRPTTPLEPASVLDGMQVEIARIMPLGTFVEATISRFDPEGTVRASAAGGARLVARRESTLSLHELTGNLLGDIDYPESQPRDQLDLSLNDQDETALATDGLFDQPDGSGTVREDLEARAQKPIPSPRLHDFLVDRVTGALRGKPQRDDISLVTVSFLLSAAPRPTTTNCRCPPFDCSGEVARSLAGDRAGGEALCRHFEQLARAIVSRILGQEWRSHWDDGCQVALERMLASLEPWKAEAPFCKYLAVVFARSAINFRRWLKRHHRMLESLDSAAEVASPASDPVLRDCLERIVSQFETRRQRVLALVAEGWTQQAIADELGVSRRAVSQWLSEMREALRPCLDH